MGYLKEILADVYWEIEKVRVKTLKQVKNYYGNM